MPSSGSGTSSSGDTGTRALGQLPNAPLIYVLAQLRFTHVPHMDRRWEDFHERIYDAYPRAETERIEQVAFRNGQPAGSDTFHRWHLSDSARTTGVIVAADTLVVHTTAYVDSNHFMDELDRLLTAFVSVLPQGVGVTRLGLRYVDLLLEEDGLSVEQQVAERLRMPTLPDIGTPQRMEQVMLYETSLSGRMVIRHRQSTTPDVLPGDIFPNRLVPARRAARLAQEGVPGTVCGLLDYDHYLEKEQAFDVTPLIETFRALRAISSAAFRATTTEAAFEKWNQAPSP